MAVKLVVVGLPGHGKSTFLNELIGEEVFRTTAGTSFCTIAGSEENIKIKEVGVDGQSFQVQLVDTAGFPHPTREETARNYADAVDNCNQSVHGVIIITNPERKSLDSIKPMLALYSGFAHLNAKLFVLANGFESCQRTSESPEQFEERSRKGREELRRSAKVVVREANLSERDPDIFVSYCIDELASAGQDVLRCVVGTHPSTSNMRLTAFDVESPRVPSIRSSVPSVPSLSRLLPPRPARTPEEEQEACAKAACFYVVLFLVVFVLAYLLFHWIGTGGASKYVSSTLMTRTASVGWSLPDHESNGTAVVVA